MTSMCLYGTLYALLPAVFVVSFRVCLSVRTSKACYGIQAPILPCTKHTLECSSGMILIQDAYYTNSTACNSTGLSSCNINVSSIPDTGRYQDFNETQLNNLYKACLNERRCTFDGGRISGNVAFSIVKFNCINNADVYNACGHVEATTSYASILWKRNNSPHEDNTCTCTISTLQSNTNLSLTALDLRLKNTRQLCPGVTITVDGNSLPVNCSQLSPYQLLVNTSQQVQVTVNKGEADVTGNVWIRIRGSKSVKLICNKKVLATTDLGPTTLPDSNSIKSSSTTDYISTLKSTSATETLRTSKACYGVQSPALSCTKHILECSSSMIAIQGAYYTNSTACTVDGLSSCNINISSIPDTGRYQDFGDTELVSLYKNCSTKSKCILNVDRKSESVNFSIIKFMCIKGDSRISGPTSSPISASYEFPGGIYVAGIFTGVVVLLLSGCLIYFLIIRRRFDLTKKQETVPASVTHPTYADLSGPQETNNYDVINRESNSETLQPSLYENVAKSP